MTAMPRGELRRAVEEYLDELPTSTWGRMFTTKPPGTDTHEMGVVYIMEMWTRIWELMSNGTRIESADERNGSKTSRVE